MQDSEQLMEEVQQLVWALVDEVATDEQIRRLENLVLEHAAARRAYVDCMSLHAELHCMFSPPRPVQPIAMGNTPAAKAPIFNLDTPPASGSPQTT
ncbi:MAG: hypothetical protein K8T91_09335 [Planctomycetes bacterium]|nr:hypothetical protein [Planctomycetota bacterium]